MSVVTNLILSTGLEQKFGPATINKFFGDARGFLLASGGPPESVDGNIEWYGGTKGMEAELYAGAFNHLCLDDLKLFLRELPRTKPELVQLIIKEQDDDLWRVESLFTANELSTL